MTDDRRERYAEAIEDGAGPAARESDIYGAARAAMAVADAEAGALKAVNAHLRGECEYERAKRADNWREVLRLRAELERETALRINENERADGLMSEVESLRAEVSDAYAVAQVIRKDLETARDENARLRAALAQMTADYEEARQGWQDAENRERRALNDGFPSVQGRCPACGRGSLFLGSGGYVTCAHIDCPEPDAASTALEGDATADARTTLREQPCVYGCLADGLNYRECPIHG